MRKRIRWLLVIVVLTLVAIAIIAIARLRATTAEERAALAMLQEPGSAPPGQNAYAALWLLPYEVPKEEQEAIVAEDVRRFQQTKLGAEFNSSAKDRYRAASEDADRSHYCSWRERGCLAKVRAAPDAYARLLESDAALIGRAEAISNYGHVRCPFPPRSDLPFPKFHYLKHPMTRHAYAFVIGDIDDGLNGTCRGISTARMLIGHGENLLDGMIGSVMLQGNANLLAEMLAELPVEHRLPASCTAALAAPAADEFSLCHAMRGEARFIFATQRQGREMQRASGMTWEDRLTSLTYDVEHTIARMAPQYAWYCSDEARAAIVADVPVKATPKPSSRIGCIDNLAGCALAEVPVSYDEYQHRLQDAGLRLRTVSTLIWLRDNPTNEPIDQRLAARPPHLHSPHREPRVTDNGASLSVQMFDSRDGAEWKVPLPASMLMAHGPSEQRPPPKQ